MKNFLTVIIVLTASIMSVIALAKDDFCIAFNNYSKTTVYLYAGKYQFINSYMVKPNETVTLSRADMKIACQPAYGKSCVVTVFLPDESEFSVISHLSLIPGTRIGYFDRDKYNWVGHKVRCGS
ncbi:MAG: hypothetical protein K0S27_580 [Gammaproteobacteria bacterium]|jgi:hypothetical protein|nr:hypothetical protein [Gammaproteobacteria bacterium]